MCSSSKEENISEQSLTGSSQASDTSEVRQIPSAPIPIAPGSAKITATIVSTEAVAEGAHCIMKVDNVHGYGSSTPPLPTGSEIKALVSTQVIESLNSSTSFESIMASENTLEITLRYIGMAKMAGSNTPDWQVASIKQ